MSRDFYSVPAAMTSAGSHGPLMDRLPRAIGDLVCVVQGLLLHEQWASAYGVTLTDERRRGSHIRSVERMVDQLLAQDGRPLTVARPVDARLVGVCRHFAVLLVAMLRAKGVPARARCGFGAYFAPGRFEDHWVCEYWDAAAARWVLVDGQIDELQRGKLQPDFDLCDVPRDRFVVAGDAWVQCRIGAADPARFGIFEMRGLWFVTGNLLRDAAALNNMEMLPWDTWGAMPGPERPLHPADIAFFDRLAALTRSPDSAFAELRALYENDGRLRVPATVRNAVLNREEAV